MRSNADVTLLLTIIQYTEGIQLECSPSRFTENEYRYIESDKLSSKFRHSQSNWCINSVASLAAFGHKEIFQREIASAIAESGL